MERCQTEALGVARQQEHRRERRGSRCSSIAPRRRGNIAATGKQIRARSYSGGSSPTKKSRMPEAATAQVPGLLEIDQPGLPLHPIGGGGGASLPDPSQDRQATAAGAPRTPHPLAARRESSPPAVRACGPARGFRRARNGVRRKPSPNTRQNTDCGSGFTPRKLSRDKPAPTGSMRKRAHRRRAL